MNRLTGFGFGALALAVSAIAPAQAADLDYRYQERRTTEYRPAPPVRYVERREFRPAVVERRVIVREVPAYPVVVHPPRHVHVYPDYPPHAHYAAPSVYVAPPVYGAVVPPADPYSVAVDVDADVLLPRAIVGPRW